ncbi:MAG: hypothetical protein DMG07_08320 [Acidobacteria bacterium]|nr:MAG: hypothetical protein DMG07_08320 [Acidobacteriota bacterium]
MAERELSFRRGRTADRERCRVADPDRRARPRRTPRPPGPPRRGLPDRDRSAGAAAPGLRYSPRDRFIRRYPAPVRRRPTLAGPNPASYCVTQGKAL